MLLLFLSSNVLNSFELFLEFLIRVSFSYMKIAACSSDLPLFAEISFLLLYFALNGDEATKF